MGTCRLVGPAVQNHTVAQRSLTSTPPPSLLVGDYIRSVYLYYFLCLVYLLYYYCDYIKWFGDYMHLVLGGNNSMCFGTNTVCFFTMIVLRKLQHLL